MRPSLGIWGARVGTTLANQERVAEKVPMTANDDRTLESQTSGYSIRDHELLPQEVDLAKQWLAVPNSPTRLLLSCLAPALVAGAIVFALVGSVLIFDSSFLGRWQGAIMPAAGVLAVSVIGVALARGMLHEKHADKVAARANRAVEEDMVSRRGELLTCRCRECIEIQEMEDEGRKHCMRVGEGKAVMFRGIDILGEPFIAPDSVFPNTRFTVLRLKTSKHFLRIQCLGERLNAVATLSGETDGYIHADGEPFDVNWEAVKAGNVRL